MLEFVHQRRAGKQVLIKVGPDDTYNRKHMAGYVIG